MKHAVDTPPATPLTEPDYRALVETAGDLIYTLDLEGRFTYANGASLNVIGYAPEEMIGRHFEVILAPHSRVVAREHFLRGLAGDNSFPFFEVEVVTASGGSAFLEVRGASLYRDGELIGRQGTARDIGELKALQAHVSERSRRVSLLEEQARIAMALYARVASFAAASEADIDALRQAQLSLQRAEADRLGLSNSDLQIIALLAEGRSNREIAGVLCRSENTIKDRLKKLMQRLGAHRRAEVVAAAAKLGLIGKP